MSKGCSRIVTLSRINNENEKQFIWRLGLAKESGQLDLNWDEIADVINREFRNDESEYRSESAYRKPFSYAKDFYEAGVFNTLNEEAYMRQLQELKDEVYKERRKLYDQRREYNKLLASDARAEHLSDEIVRAAYELQKCKPLDFDNGVIERNKHKEGLMCWADWHYGLVTDNIWNTYNTAICRKRVEKFINTSIEYIRLNKIDTLNIIMLGDAAHGAIHTSCRVAAEENTCDQIMQVAEIMAEAISRLSSEVNRINVYSSYGNHLRSIQNKNDSVHSDNMEKLIPWWLMQRLQNNTKVNVIGSEYEEFTCFKIFDKSIVMVHGDLDKFKDLGVIANTIFTKKFGRTVDYTVSADKHHLEMMDRFSIESILVPSLCGTDDYAHNNRLYSKAGQTLLIFNDDYGLEAIYNVPLD